MVPRSLVPRVPDGTTCRRQVSHAAVQALVLSHGHHGRLSNSPLCHHVRTAPSGSLFRSKCTPAKGISVGFDELAKEPQSPADEARGLPPANTLDFRAPETKGSRDTNDADE